MRTFPKRIANYRVLRNLGSCWIRVSTLLSPWSFCLSQVVAWVWGSMIRGTSFMNVRIWLFSIDNWSLGRPFMIYWRVAAYEVTKLRKLKKWLPNVFFHFSTSKCLMFSGQWERYVTKHAVMAAFLGIISTSTLSLSLSTLHLTFSPSSFERSYCPLAWAISAFLSYYFRT